VGISLRLSKVATTVKSTSRKSIRLGLVAGLLVTGLVGVTSLTAAGSGGSSTVPYGTLTISLTDRAGSLKLERSDGVTFTQALDVATPCSTLVAGPVVPAGTVSGNLLDFSAETGGSAPNVQLPSNGIGVTDGANCGDPAGLIGPGETLTLDLGGFLPADVTVSTGTLQIGKSRGNDGDVRVAYDGGELRAGHRLQSAWSPFPWRTLTASSGASRSVHGDPVLSGPLAADQHRVQSDGTCAGDGTRCCRPTSRPWPESARPPSRG
jgi:hypothetical protein